MKISILEDDKIQSSNLKILLNNLGYDNVVVYENSLLACAEINKNGSDILFCDIRLPQVDGVTFLTELLDPSCVAYVVLMSEVGEDLIDLTCKLCSIIGYSFVDRISKPCDINNVKRIFDNFEFRHSNNVSKKALNHVSKGDCSEIEFNLIYSKPSKLCVGVDSSLPVASNLSISDYIHESIRMMSKESCDTHLTLNLNVQDLDGSINQIISEACDKFLFPTNVLILNIKFGSSEFLMERVYKDLVKTKLLGVKISASDISFSNLNILSSIPFNQICFSYKEYVFDGKAYASHQLLFSLINFFHAIGVKTLLKFQDDVFHDSKLEHLDVDYYQTTSFGGLDSLNDCLKKSKEKTAESPIRERSIIIYGLDFVENRSFKNHLEENVLNHNFFSTSNLRELKYYIDLLELECIIIHSCLGDDFSEMRKLVIENKLSVISFIDLDLDLLGGAFYTRVSNFGPFHENASNLTMLLKTRVQDNKILLPKLSKREEEIARFILLGYSNVDISKILEINQKTVSTYKYRMFSKLNVGNVAEFVAKYVA